MVSAVLTVLLPVVKLQQFRLRQGRARGVPYPEKPTVRTALTVATSLVRRFALINV